MWVWSKLSAARWEDAWEERFHGNPNVVMTRLKGGKSLRIDVYCRTQDEAEEIVGTFGGSVRKMDKDWQVQPVVTAPLRIRDQVVITQQSKAAALQKLRREFPGRALVSIPPEMAFGTGDHATTAACLRFLADEARARRGNEWRMLDLGCGSGVLAIVAAVLGASSCEAIDYDPKAVEVATRNVKRNGADGVRVEEADVLTWKPRGRYEVVAANLFAGVLQQAVPRMRRVLAPDGRLILSGILHEQWPETCAVVEGAGFSVLSSKRRGKWVSALAAAG